jgi:hypothetical protein
MIVNFEELLLHCREESSKEHIREAVRCYHSGAYRAAIVTCYMAVCFDLIAKLKALAAGGDGRAIELQERLSKLQKQNDEGNDQAISGLLNFERQLIEKFKDEFEFFGVNEYDDLKRLRDDRNRCAHPTFLKSDLPYAPTAELARMHIRNSLSFVLSQDPKQGKAALSEIQSVVLSSYFPTEIEEAKTRLRSTGLGSARESLIRAAVDDLIYGIVTDGHPYFRRVSPYVALDAIIEINRPVALPRALAATNKLLVRSEDSVVDAAAVIVLRNREVGESVDVSSRGVMQQWIEKTQVPSLPNAVRRALGLPWLSEAALKRLNTFSAEHISKMTGELPRQVLRRAAEIYVTARSWETANRLAEQCAIPFADRFNLHDLDFIFDEARNGKADLEGSGGFTKFLRALYSESPLGPSVLDELTAKYDFEFYRPTTA